MLAKRLAIALIEGLALLTITYFYNEGKGQLGIGIVAPLTTIIAAISTLLILGLTTIKPQLLACWLLGAAVIVGWVSFHQIVRMPPTIPDRGYGADILPVWNNFSANFATALALFIGQALVMATSADDKIIASYPSYFDAAWKLAVQFVLSGLFLLVFWLMIRLGWALFDIINIESFHQIVSNRWFIILSTALLLALSIHITDVRPNIIRGVRTLKLTLFSWLLPVMTIITSCFLISLCFTGLRPVWRTHYAAGLFLGVALVLIYMINATYQDGGEEQTRNRFLKQTGRLSALLLLPLLTLAIYGTVIRIRADGLTVSRIMLTVGLLIGGQYAIGYAAAVFDQRSWMKRLETTNIVGAFLMLALYVMLFTPIADPARLAVHTSLRAEMASDFASVNSRFDSVDSRFDSVNSQFDAIGYRFDAVDARFDGLTGVMNTRFEAVDRRLDALDRDVGAITQHLFREKD